MSNALLVLLRLDKKLKKQQLQENQNLKEKEAYQNSICSNFLFFRLAIGSLSSGIKKECEVTLFLYIIIIIIIIIITIRTVIPVKEHGSWRYRTY